MRYLGLKNKKFKIIIQLDVRRIRLQNENIFQAHSQLNIQTIYMMLIIA